MKKIHQRQLILFFCFTFFLFGWDTDLLGAKWSGTLEYKYYGIRPIDNHRFRLFKSNTSNSFNSDTDFDGEYDAIGNLEINNNKTIDIRFMTNGTDTYVYFDGRIKVTNGQLTLRFGGGEDPYTSSTIKRSPDYITGPLIEMENTTSDPEKCKVTIKGKTVSSTDYYIIISGGADHWSVSGHNPSGDTKAEEPLIVMNGGTLTLDKVKFQRIWNIKNNEAGVIQINEGTNSSNVVSIQDCHIFNCVSGARGTALLINDPKASSSVTLTNTRIYNCFTNDTTANDNYGGIIRSLGTNKCSLTINGGLIHDNHNKCSGTSSKGTIGWEGEALLQITGCKIYDNWSACDGGGIYANGNVTISDCNIYDNIARNGGGVYIASEGTLNVSGTLTITGNTTTANAINNVFIPSGATEKFINIASDGLDCGSSIGVTKTFSGTYTQIAQGLGSAATTNCTNACKNRYLFNDSGIYGIYNLSISPYSSDNLYFIDSWKSHASSVSESGNTYTVSTAAELAYIAQQVNSGTTDYSGKVIQLSADINLNDYYWDPIGECYTDCNSNPVTHAFRGTFDGKGHTITNLNNGVLPFENMGLFGYTTGTIKNIFVTGALDASGSTYAGGIVGLLDGGQVYNCGAVVVLTDGTTKGGLVGGIISDGSLKNSYAISNDPACGSGTATNCYVRLASGGTSNNMGNAFNVGTANTNGTFTETVTPYLYKHDDNKVESASLLSELNAWVAAQSSPTDLARWTRTCASRINGDYPLLKFEGTNCVGTKSGSNDVLTYGSSLNTILGTHNASGDNIFFWGTESGVSGDINANVYFDEDAALIHTGTIANAYVGITLKDAEWHMFSPAVNNAPLGINYNGDDNVYPYHTAPEVYNFYPEATADGYFPSTNFGGGSYYNDYDYYCYYEPEYHWINFKRNSVSHWHADGQNGTIEYHWDNNPDNTMSVGHETYLKPGKGYLLSTRYNTYLQSHGTLNSGDVVFPVTKKGDLRTGYNLIGNPYQAYLDFNDFAEANSGTGKIWEDATSAFYLMIYGGAYHQHVYGASNNELQAPRCLHPHQGFMVITKSNTDANFQNGMCTLSDAVNAPFRGDVNINYPLVNLIATDEDGKSDIVTIELGRPEIGGAPKAYDLRTGKGCIYANYEDKDYAIAFTQPGLGEMAVRFFADEQANFTMTWDMENGEFNYVHLIDNMTGSDIDCLNTNEYHFTARPSDYKSRFRLVFDYTGVDETSDPAGDLSHFAFQMNNELVVNGEGQLQMFDLTGRLVMSVSTYGAQSRVALPEISSGLYVLRINEKNGVKTQKIVIE